MTEPCAITFGHLWPACRARSSMSTIRAATIQLARPVGRFRSGVVRCPPLALDRLGGSTAYLKRTVGR